MIYVFRVMTCDEYYKSHEPYDGLGSRCSVNEIEALTARAVSFAWVNDGDIWYVSNFSPTERTGISLLIRESGVFNLLVTAIVMRRYGLKVALIVQCVVPILRLLVQIVAGEFCYPDNHRFYI